MKNVNSFFISTFVSTIAFLVAVPLLVSGAERRIAGTNCVAAEESQNFRDLGYPSYFRGTVSNRFSGTTVFECPINDDSLFPKWAVNTMYVHGNMFSGARVEARACSVAQQLSVNSPLPVISCGIPQTTDSVSGGQLGDFILRFDFADLREAWGPEHAFDYAFVQIRFSNLDNTNGIIKGIFLFNQVCDDFFPVICALRP
jgi:hypothetical protein